VEESVDASSMFILLQEATIISCDGVGAVDSMSLCNSDANENCIFNVS
jgi:hypothetical protein